MTIEHGHTDGAHLITKFRAFLHDNGMPGVRLEKDSGQFIDVVFSVAALGELQVQLSKALQMARSSSQKRN